MSELVDSFSNEHLEPASTFDHLLHDEDLGYSLATFSATSWPWLTRGCLASVESPTSTSRVTLPFPYIENSGPLPPDDGHSAHHPAASLQVPANVFDDEGASDVVSVDDSPRSAPDTTVNESSTSLSDHSSPLSTMRPKSKAYASKTPSAKPPRQENNGTKPPSKELDIVRRFERTDDAPLTETYLRNLSLLSRMPKEMEKVIDYLLKFKEMKNEHHEAQAQTLLAVLQTRDDFTTHFNESGFSEAIIRETIAFLLVMQKDSKKVCKSFFLLVASCIIGRGRHYCHSGNNPTKQSLTLEAVYRCFIAINEDR